VAIFSYANPDEPRARKVSIKKFELNAVEASKFPHLSVAPYFSNVASMPAGFDAAFAKVKQLVADFRANEKFYLSPAYQEMSFAHWMGEGGRRPNEGSGNRDFIDKFWLALGWDVNHETQKKL
jgi:hypothetical protein